MSYQEFRVTIAPQAPFLTPLMADTLWGHLVCRLAEQAPVTQWVSADNTEPPLILSDAFPEGWLPAPALPAPPAPADLPLASILRRALKQDLWPEPLVQQVLQAPEEMPGVLQAAAEEALAGQRCPLTLAPGSACAAAACPVLAPGAATLEDKRACAERVQAVRPRPVARPGRHVTISRADLGALEGQLYDLPDQWLPHRWVLWARTTLPAEELQRLLALVGACGYGARAAVGKGHFVVCEVCAASPLPPPGHASGFMLLNSCLPVGAPWPERACGYRLRLKRGKRHLSSQFIKKPVAMFRAGSLFTDEGEAPFVGQVLPHIHGTAAEIVECGLGYPLRF